MPAKPPIPPAPDPDPAPAKPTTAAPEQTPGAVPIPGLLPAGIYEFTGPYATQYLHVPLTARPAGVDGPATVFDWPFGAPDDGRWQLTRKKPNQVADNAAPLSPEE